MTSTAARTPAEDGPRDVHTEQNIEETAPVHKTSTQRRRTTTKLLVLASLIILLGAVVDRVTEGFAERRLASTATEAALQYDLNTTDTRVEIVGFGFLPQLFRGEFTSAEITMQDATITSIPIEQLDITLSGVSVPRSPLGSSTEDINVARTDVALRLTPESLAELANSTNTAEDIQLDIVDGQLRARVDVAYGTQYTQISGVVNPSVENNRVYFESTRTSSGLSEEDERKFTTQLSSGVALPALPFDVAVRDISTVGESVLLTADAENVTL